MGGGSAGAVSYPSYMQDYHKDVLNNTGADSMAVSVVDGFNSARTASPYTGVSAYNPDTTLSTAEAYITALNAAVVAMAHLSDINAAYLSCDAMIPLGVAVLDSIVVDTVKVAAEVAAYDVELTDKLENLTLPSFKAGMLNINAVASSSFVL